MRYLLTTRRPHRPLLPQSEFKIGVSGCPAIPRLQHRCPSSRLQPRLSTARPSSSLPRWRLPSPSRSRQHRQPPPLARWLRPSSRLARLTRLSGVIWLVGPWRRCPLRPGCSTLLSWILLSLVRLQRWLVEASLRQLQLSKPMEAGCMWVGVAATTEVLPLIHQRRVLSAAGVLRPSGRGKVSSVALPSSVGLEEGAFVASSVATKSALVVVLSDASVVVSLVIGRGSVVLALRLLVIALQLPALALRSLVLLLRQAALRLSSLVLR